MSLSSSELSSESIAFAGLFKHGAGAAAFFAAFFVFSFIFFSTFLCLAFCLRNLALARSFFALALAFRFLACALSSSLSLDEEDVEDELEEVEGDEKDEDDEVVARGEDREDTRGDRAATVER